MQKSSFSIRRVGNRHATAVEACSDQSFARHTHDEYGIGVMLAGAQRSWSGRGIVEAGVGDLITVNPGEVHDGAPIGKSRSWAMLYLPTEETTVIVTDICDGNPAVLEFSDPVMRNRRAAVCFKAAYAALITGEDEDSYERLIVLVSGLLRNVSKRPVGTQKMIQAKERIDDDPTGCHPLDELACEAGASRFQTLRSFAGLTGLTPHAYIVQRRLDIGRLMIRDRKSLADAAAAAGFADQSHFHRSFTRRYRLTPGAYAAAMR
jgi:AraC-like DNA-binding protein/quercetin dioxygenase-like cupin family protein